MRLRSVDHGPFSIPCAALAALSFYVEARGKQPVEAAFRQGSDPISLWPRSLEWLKKTSKNDGCAAKICDKNFRGPPKQLSHPHGRAPRGKTAALHNVRGDEEDAVSRQMGKRTTETAEPVNIASINGC
jgi:hypothetical protein